MKLAQYTLEAKNKHQYFTIEAAAVDSARGSSIDSVQPTLCRLNDIAVKSSQVLGGKKLPKHQM